MRVVYAAGQSAMGLPAKRNFTVTESGQHGVIFYRKGTSRYELWHTFLSRLIFEQIRNMRVLLTSLYVSFYLSDNLYIGDDSRRTSIRIQRNAIRITDSVRQK